jgi:hypothetical protein
VVPSYAGEPPCEPAGAVLTCTLAAPLAPGGQVYVQLRLSVTGPTPALLASATVSGGGVTDPAPANDRAQLLAADLTVTATRGADPVVAGGSLPLDLTVTNNGPAGAPDTTVSVYFYAQEVQSIEASVGTVRAGSDLVWDIGDLAPGARAHLHLVVRVEAARDSVRGDLQFAALDLHQADNVIRWDVRPAPEGLADLTIEPTTVTPAENHTFFLHLAVRNTGPAAIGASEAEPLLFSGYDPSYGYNMTLTSASVGWTCNGAACLSNEPLAAGATVELDAVVQTSDYQPNGPLYLRVEGGTTAEADLINNDLILRLP